MRALSEAQFTVEAAAAFDRVFTSAGPFGASFASGITSRLLLFPVRYRLDRALMRRVATAAAEGDDAFYLSVLERPSAEEEDRPYHWHIPFSELVLYDGLGYPFVLENAIYSTQGKWGVIFSHEAHALVGGPQQFVRAIRSAAPDPSTQMIRFLDTWKSHRARLRSDVGWVPGLVRHVYGEDAAGPLLARHGFEGRGLGLSGGSS